MKKTCALFGVGLIGSIAGYYFLIDHFIPAISGIPVIIFSFLGGFSALALFGAVSSLVQSLSDKAVIARAVKGQPFRDGKRAAALGRIEPAGLANVTAPFSGKDCLAYEYEVYEWIRVPGKGSDRKEIHCSGFGMAPSVIRSAQGDVRLLGFPILDEWTKELMEQPVDRDRCIAFLRETPFVNIKTNIGSAFSEFDDMFRDADGAVRKDFGQLIEIEDKHYLAEAVVPRGTEVCAIGVYSQQNNALFAKNAALPIRLVPGNAKEAEQRLRKASTSSLVFGLAFFLIFNAILGIAYYGSPKNPQNIPAPDPE